MLDVRDGTTMLASDLQNGFPADDLRIAGGLCR
jgi:hypothetical protein